MGKKITKGAVFNSSFVYSSAVPIDNRFVVENTSDLTSNDVWEKNGVSNAYVGLQVYCEEDNSIYVLTKAAYNTTSNWKKIATSDQVSGGTNYKGVKNSLTALNKVSSPSAGDMYYVTHAELETVEDLSSVDGAFYIHNGISWDKINKEDAAHATLADSAKQLQTTVNINGWGFNGTKNIVNLVSCDTAADSAAKTVNATGFTVGNGSTIKVKFTHANSAANPKLNGYNMKRGSLPFDVWEANSIVTFTFVGETNNGTTTGEWQAGEVEAQNIIVRQISKVDYATFDFDNNNKNNSIYEHANPISTDTSARDQLFNDMYALGQNPDGRLHFLKFRGKRYKFDIGTAFIQNNIKTIVFSFIYSGTAGSSQDKFAKLVTITWNKTSEDPLTYSYKYDENNLIGSGDVTTADLAKKANLSDFNALQKEVNVLRQSTKWYSLDESSNA